MTSNYCQVFFSSILVKYSCKNCGIVADYSFDWLEYQQNLPSAMIVGLDHACTKDLESMGEEQVQA
jgi:hypothetical protein